MNTASTSTSFYIYRRDLPHWRADNVVYFVTWRVRAFTSPLTSDERSIIARAIEHFHPDRYRLFAYVVMDDHVHVVVRISPGYHLQNIVHSWKAYTANCLQRCSNRLGAVWQQEYYDRIIRDEREFWATLRYVADNPAKRWSNNQSYEWVRVYGGGSDGILCL